MYEALLKRVFWLLLFGVLGCGGAKKTKQLIAPEIITNSKESHRLDSIASLVANIADPASNAEQRVSEHSSLPVDELDVEEPSQEQVLLEQKRLGMYADADFTPAMHFDLRKPNFVIIHHTAQQSTEQTIRTFKLPHTKVSAHYVIGKDGQVVQMLNDYDRAWHAGRSKWGNNTDLNSSSIGIELDNDGAALFPEEQINSLLLLLDTLKSKYRIPQLNFIGHADIAPTRKDDPSVSFPWKKLAEHGFGIWYNETYLVPPPATFNPIDALKIMGYDMSQPRAAIRAFKRKFIVVEVNDELTDYDSMVLYDLYRKYY